MAGSHQSSLATHAALKNRKNDKNTLTEKSANSEVFFSVNPSAPIPKSEPLNYSQLQL